MLRRWWTRTGGRIIGTGRLRARPASARRWLVGSVLAAAVVTPIIIGASCPPPDQPFYLFFTAEPGQRQLPSCLPGSICIVITNQTCSGAFVDASLYIDTALQVLTSRATLFVAGNVQPISGRNVYRFQYGESITIPINCADIVSMGVAATFVTDTTIPPPAVLTNPDWAEGPAFQCDQNVPANTTPGVLMCDQIVPCGETIEFRMVDLGGCANPANVSLWIPPIDCGQVSQVCWWYNDAACGHQPCDNVADAPPEPTP